MNREDWPVQEYGIRPAGSPDHCFYCGRARGTIHKTDCVIRQRTVVLRFEIEMVCEAPERETPDDIESRYNEGSWCGGNIIDYLEQYRERTGSCMCNEVTVKFVREATEEDEKTGNLTVAEIPS